MNKDNKKEIIKLINRLSDRRSSYKVFSDMIMCCAYSLSNLLEFKQEREDRYKSIMNEYGSEGVEIGSKILACLFDEYENGSLEDILGSIYMEMGFGNKNTAQFFTPQSLSDLMSDLTLKKEDIERELKEKNYITINDPACGSGRTLYSALKTLKKYDIDIHKALIVADDIDPLCCAMTYIQLNLMSAVAIINNKDTLSNEIYDTYYTLGYMFNNEIKIDINNSKNDKEKDEEIEK